MLKNKVAFYTTLSKQTNENKLNQKKQISDFFM